MEVTSEKKSLALSASAVTDEERRVVGASKPSDMINSINEVELLPKESVNGQSRQPRRTTAQQLARTCLKKSNF